MRPQFKVLVIAGALLTASLGGSASAAAATAAAPPVMDTSVLACGHGVCEVGPGNVGMAFSAGLNVTGDGVSGKFAGQYFRMTVISGSLQLSLPSTEWTVTGTRPGRVPIRSPSSSPRHRPSPRTEGRPGPSSSPLQSAPAPRLPRSQPGTQRTAAAASSRSTRQGSYRRAPAARDQAGDVAGVPQWRRPLAEPPSSAFLVAAVKGFGIAAQRLSPVTPGRPCRGNATATAAGLYAIIEMPLSPLGIRRKPAHITRA